MKKCLKTFFVLLFFLCVSTACLCFFCSEKNLKCAKATTSQENLQNMVFEFDFNGKKFKYLSEEVLPKLELSKNQLKCINSPALRLETFNKIRVFLSSDYEALLYAYPELEFILEKISSAVYINAIPPDVTINKNTCTINFDEGRSGVYLNKQAFTKQFITEAKKQDKKISFKLSADSYTETSDIKENMKEKGCFSTNFSSSNESRKNNIRVALSAFDGIILEEGEMLSFNEATGIRCAENGYMPAKIISGGTFTEGFGGGVCQVSTTLYNACLLAGLEIVEVHNHSLPVSYVEPSFDAMVNVGSSDLVVRNNSGGKILFTTSSKNDICKVKIFGTKNKYKITRHSEKTKILPAEPDEVVTDYVKYSPDLEVGEAKRISYPKDGYCSNGYLNYYNANGELVETKKIRSNRYNPTKGIVVKREN